MSSMSKKPLEIVEQISIIASFGGSLASVFFQQAILAALPLSITVGLNFLNRQELLQTLQELSEQNHNSIIELANQNQKLITELGEKIEILQGNNHKINSLEQKVKQLQNNEQSPSVLSNLNEVKEKLENLENNRLNYLNTNNQKVFEDIKELQEVTKNFQKIINSNPPESNYLNSSELYYQKGLENENLGTQDIAIQNYTLAIQCDNNHGNAYYQRGNLYAQMGNKQAALDDLRHASKLFFEQGDIDKYQQAKDASKKLHDLSNTINNKQSESQLLFLDNLLS